ncbi:MAG TPA: hypothetical protein VJT71_11890 [Pyrinomonadaceae bacterium]|nr:hypothetical protein [Pyrinomonadaceae bacterium]
MLTVPFRLASVFWIWFFLAVSSAPFTFSQSAAKQIGSIDFYGYAGRDLNRVRAALPIREGELFMPSDQTVFETKAGIRAAVKKATGSAATDVAVVCCDGEGNS